MKTSSVCLQRGFTLIETMLTLVIVGILLSTALPSMRNVLLGVQSRGARDTLMSSLQLARNSALTRGGDVIVCPSSDGQTCSGKTSWHDGWIVFGDTNRDDQRNSEETLILTSQHQPTGQAILSTAGRTHVTYRADGSATGTNLTISFCDSRGAAQASAIIINNAGRPRTGQPAASQAAAACAAI